MSDGQTHIHEDGTVHAHEPGAESAHSHHHTNTRAVKNRLARVIGHLHAVERMVQDERDCAEILIQLAAVRSALNNVCKMILKDHMEHCVIDAIRNEDNDAITELNKAIDLLMK
ncbi:MAG: metal-sensing transcriptional repressor [Oscillospiraceae bacterium]|nr:metal-sensing transcriptional repressor [Oscillospiraceae bacterium]